ncbi:33004_t:CDS:2, partial [Gigaspora margarita]
EKSSSLNTIKGYIKYINNHPVYYINYGPNFELEIISNHSSSNTATKTQRFNKLSISTKKACAKTVAKKIKKDFNQIAKENYYLNDQVTLKELSYTVANTPFQVEFGSQNIIEKNKHKSAIVQIIDKYQISKNRYHALLAIQPNLLRDYAVSNQRTILTSKMANYIPIETFNLSNQDNLFIKDILLYLHPYLVANKILHSSKPVINLRISGDGHNVRKKINHVIITLAILDQKKELYLSDNHYTIVIYSDIEKYELLKSATQSLVDELNKLQQSGFVDKNGINWSINLYFFSDWKFLALCLGINMANSINFCPWCQCKKTDLGNLKKQSWTIKKVMNIIASNYLAYPGHIQAPLFPIIPLNHWSLIISELEQNGEYDDDMRETICNEMKKCKNKFDQLYCAIKNPDIDFTQFALDAKKWEAYFLKPDITDPNNQDIIVEE